MGFGFRKSFNLIGSFLRLTFGKSGVGLSAGGKGFRLGLGPMGKHISASLPGTGLYYRKTEAWGKSSTGISRQIACPKCGKLIGNPENPSHSRASFIKHLKGGLKFGGHALTQEEADNIANNISPGL